MSEDEKRRDLNRRVAKALSYRATEEHMGWVLVAPDGARVTPPGVSYTSAGMAWEDCPDFCTSPAAADLVRQEIERRGWDSSTSSRWCEATQKRIYRHFIKQKDGYEIGEGYSDDSPHHALCLAFLAACEAAKKAEVTK